MMLNFKFDTLKGKSFIDSPQKWDSKKVIWKFVLMGGAMYVNPT